VTDLPKDRRTGIPAKSISAGGKQDGNSSQIWTKPTKIVNRVYLLQVQVRNLLARTTATSQQTLAKFDTALRNQWIETIGAYGLDGNGCCHVGLQLRIDWLTHAVHVLLDGDTVRIDRTVYIDDLAPEVMNGIVVFNQAVNAECLYPKWQMTHPHGADAAHIRRELGFVAGATLTWAGRVERQTYTVAEVPELTVTFLEAVPEPEKAPEQGLFDRIKDAFG
jgi:hypothetical protein